MPRFVHIDISADRPERAAAFYRQAFGWTVTRLDGPVPYWLVAVDSADPNAMGAGIGQRTEPWQTTVPTIDVANADKAAATIVEAGGSIVIPKTRIPGVGQLVTFKDTEGNVMAVLESDPAGQWQAGPAGAQGAT
ncbi:VOC family protein [Devosia sp. CN2-171]|uniref:VOC family protein n=1 Tax=Devosia sp. CN2-171 TaxID=3400909 RepID=UPI003BF834D6